MKYSKSKLNMHIQAIEILLKEVENANKNVGHFQH